MEEVAKRMKTHLQDELKDFRSKLRIKQPGDIEKRIVHDIAEVLGTEPVQALADRYQLGLVYDVYNDENVKHTRLDHTVGVVAKCIVAADWVNTNSSPEVMKLTETDVRELAVAAALHDCGHLPISHATERAYTNVPGLKKGLTHEERIIPLITNRNPYFDPLRTVVLKWTGFNPNSFYRIASIICPDVTEEFEQQITGFRRPKRAIQQLLVSDIDMDRLDYVIRDASKLGYQAVTLLEDKIVEYVKGLSLVKFKSLDYAVGKEDIKDSYENKEQNVELCLSHDKVEYVFYFLVSRVLLYKYVYFSPEVRSFEGVLTYLVGTLIKHNVALEPLKLIAMSDDEFIENYLSELVSYIDNEDEKKHLQEKYINVLKMEKVQRFKPLASIHAEEIKNPRLKEEFEKNINSRIYIENLRNYLDYSAKKEKNGFYMERADLLFDVFKLKTGGGSLLIKKTENGKTDYYTLKKTMNGSNMHRLCSETRLDIYGKSDLSERKKDFIKKRIDKFFKTM